MRDAPRNLLIALALVPAIAAGKAADPAPEVQRPPGGTPQPPGQVHTLRNIPEACVRLQGVFTGEAGTPYRFEAVRHERCAQRAVYRDIKDVEPAPSRGKGWILNDRIQVARSDRTSCVATIEIWRHPGEAAPPSLDPQGRSRLYLDKPPPQVLAPIFTAILRTDACG